MESSSNRMQNIQYFRVIACLGVLTVHVGQILSLSGAIRVITDFGRYGVHFFLIISGYLAFFSYERSSSLWNYYLKRIIRILPLYYFVILFYFIEDTFILHSVPVDSTGLNWLKYVFFLNGFVYSSDGYWNNLGATWSIPVFVLFYLLVPLLYKLAKNFYSILIAYIAALIIALSIRFSGTQHFNAIYYLVFCIAGVLCYQAVKLNLQMETICFFALTTVFFIIQSATTEYIVLNIFPILLISSQNIKIPFSFFNKAVSFVDRYSYTIYLTQGLIFHNLSSELTNPCLIFGITVLGTFTLSIIIYHLVESPLQSLLYRFVRK